MQVRSLPSFALPPLPTNTLQRTQPSVTVPENLNRKPESNNVDLLARQNQRYSYVKVDAEGSKASRALQTYFNIETQDEQERSQALFGVDILV